MTTREASKNLKEEDAPNEDERLMQDLLRQEYKKRNKFLLDEVRKWRERNPDASYGDAIRALYEAMESE